MYRRWFAVLTNLTMLTVVIARAGLGQVEEASGPIGFAVSSRAAEIRAEGRALAIPTPEKARAWLRALTEEPHVAGTPADYKTAVDVRDKLRAWGWQAELVEYEVLLNYPRGAELEIVRPKPQELKVFED